MTIVILGDGDFPTAAYPLEVLKTADKIICCDGSLLQLLHYDKEMIPDYIVGDMDSLPHAYQEQYKSIIHKSECQQTNDQTKAFSFALGIIPAGERANIHILGATGRREDHTLGNISLLLDYAVPGKVIEPFGHKMRQEIGVDIITNHGIFTPRFDTFTASGTKGQQISIFSFDPTLKIKSAGLLYPTDQVIFDLWWKATLNECTHSTYTLTFSHPAKVLVFANDFATML